MKKKRNGFLKTVSTTTLFGASYIVPAIAHAQVAGFSLSRFDPSDRGSEWFTGESLDLRGRMRPAIGFVHDGAYRPFVIYNDDGTARASIVRYQLFLHAGVSLVFLDRFRIAANLPIAIYQEGQAATLSGIRYRLPNTQSLGDLRVGADVRVVGEYGEPFTLGLGVHVFVPTGSREDFTSDGDVRVHPRLLAAGDIGVFAYSAQVGFQYRGLEDTFAGVALGSEATFAASAGVRLASGNLVIGPEVYGSTVVKDEIFSKKTTPVEALFGFHYAAGGFRFGLGRGVGLTSALGSPAARWAASLEWTPAIPDAKADADDDGVPDITDACPNESGVRTSDAKTSGCPQTILEPSDRDHDGILDGDDACPDVAGVKSNDAKVNGCPPDADKDGIPDPVDACPEAPGPRTTDPRTNGCPPTPKVADVDNDSVADKDDACPNEPGKPDADPKKNGCPPAFEQGAVIKITHQVKFEHGSAELLKDAGTQAALDQVMAVMKEHPEIVNVRVEGHTDNKGSAAYNKRLSERRAAAVVQSLIKRGADAGRLVAVGQGMERPIEDNSTEEGRTNNRRVEFHVEMEK